MAASHSPAEFVEVLQQEFREEMREAVDEHFNEAYFDGIGGPEALVRAMFPDYAWRELFLGTLPTTRQLDLVYRQGDPYHGDRDIVVGLTKQLNDEIKHARMFSNFAEQFDAPADMTTWTPGHYETNVEMCRAAVEYERPHLVAAAFSARRRSRRRSRSGTWRTTSNRRTRTWPARSGPSPPTRATTSTSGG